MEGNGSTRVPDARCAHPGCERPATDVAVVESAWEDAATGSAMMMCAEHADAYARAGSQEAMQRARRRPAGR
ncbi:MAG: hypothetical protein ACXVQ0_05775 [Actinomycetota bacterium]